MKLDLQLLRHAKSDWAAGAQSDHDRPLAPRGVAAAEAVGRWLAERELLPELVVASTAVRAAETARLVLRAAGCRAQLRQAGSFYESDVSTMLEAVRALDDASARVMLVGHEPVWSALASFLTGGGKVRMPTAAVAGIRFELGSWRDVDGGTGELRFLVTPRVLPGGKRDDD